MARIPTKEEIRSIYDGLSIPCPFDMTPEERGGILVDCADGSSIAINGDYKSEIRRTPDSEAIQKMFDNAGLSNPFAKSEDSLESGVIACFEDGHSEIVTEGHPLSSLISRSSEIRESLDRGQYLVNISLIEKLLHEGSESIIEYNGIFYSYLNLEK